MFRLLLIAVCLTAAASAQSPTIPSESAPEAVPDSTLAAWGSARVLRREGLRVVSVPGTPGRLDVSVTLYRSIAPDRARYPYTLLLGDGYTNKAPLTDHAERLAEYVAQRVGVDPARTAFVFRLALHRRDGHDLFLLATFGRDEAGALRPATWRPLTLDEASTYTEGRDWRPAMDKGEWVEADQCLALDER